MNCIKPFSGDADSIPIGDLTVENGPDRIAMYGSVNITKDKAGLALAHQLKELIDATVASLHVETNLPDHIPLAPSETVDNPFK
jgi:hypothetical protein